MRMVEMEIPKEHWRDFLDTLSLEVLGRPVRLEMEGMELGDQLVGRFLPLRGIDFETKGSQAGDLLVLLGPDAEAQGHRIAQPVRMFVAFNELSELVWLGFEQEDGGKALLLLEQQEALPLEFGGPSGTFV